jgi:hypothetical protein
MASLSRYLAASPNKQHATRERIRLKGKVQRSRQDHRTNVIIRISERKILVVLERRNSNQEGNANGKQLAAYWGHAVA